MKRLFLIIILMVSLTSILVADQVEDSIAAKVNDLFMKASSGEVQFRDLVEPAKKELIEMGAQAVPQMITKLKTEDARERQTVEDLFKGIGDPAVPYLIEALNTDNLYQMRLAASCLGKIGNKAGTGPLLRLFSDSQHTVRSAAVTAVGEIKDTAAIPGVIVTLSDSCETVRKSAAVALGRIGDPDPDVISSLINKFDDNHFSVRYTAANSLVQIGEKSGEKLLENFNLISALAKGYALEVWAGLKYKKALPVLEKLLNSNDPYFRGQAILAIAQINPDKARRLLRKKSDSEQDLFVLSCFSQAEEMVKTLEK